MKKSKLVMDITSHPAVYKKSRKQFISKKLGLCPICPFHGGENTRRNRFQKCWKKYRKNQWKVKNDNRIRSTNKK